MKAKLLRLCYFRKITSEETRDIIADFHKEQVDKQKCYQACKKQIRQAYPIDWIKVFLLVLSLVILACSIAVLPLFLTNCSVMFGAVTRVLYGLYPAQLLCITIGLVGRKINFRGYKYHWFILVVQLIVTLLAYLFVFYEVANSLSGF